MKIDFIDYRDVSSVVTNSDCIYVGKLEITSGNFSIFMLYLYWIADSFFSFASSQNTKLIEHDWSVVILFLNWQINLNRSMTLTLMNVFHLYASEKHNQIICWCYSWCDYMPILWTINWFYANTVLILSSACIHFKQSLNWIKRMFYEWKSNKYLSLFGLVQFFELELEQSAFIPLNWIAIIYPTKKANINNISSCSLLYIFFLILNKQNTNFDDNE